MVCGFFLSAVYAKVPPTQFHYHPLIDKVDYNNNYINNNYIIIIILLFSRLDPEAEMPTTSDESILLPKPVIDSCYASILRCYQEMFPSSFSSKTALTKKLSTNYDLKSFRIKPLNDENYAIQFKRSPRNSPRSSLRESKSKTPLQMMASLRRSFR